MPVKSLAKVQKHVKAKKGSKITALHEHSRDARRLQRASARGDKIATKVAQREKANLPHLSRVLFLQSCLPTTEKPTPYDIPSIQDLISLFLSRHGTELSQIAAERRPGRPPATREVALKQQVELDEKEYKSGFWTPDLRDEDTLFSVQNWKGEWAGMNTMKFIRVARDGSVKESSFPPKGQS